MGLAQKTLPDKQSASHIPKRRELSKIPGVFTPSYRGSYANIVSTYKRSHVFSLIKNKLGGDFLVKFARVFQSPKVFQDFKNLLGRSYKNVYNYRDFLYEEIRSRSTRRLFERHQHTVDEFVHMCLDTLLELYPDDHPIDNQKTKAREAKQFSFAEVDGQTQERIKNIILPESSMTEEWLKIFVDIASKPRLLSNLALKQYLRQKMYINSRNLNSDNLKKVDEVYEDILKIIDEIVPDEFQIDYFENNKIDKELNPLFCYYYYTKKVFYQSQRLSTKDIPRNVISCIQKSKVQNVFIDNVIKKKWHGVKKQLKNVKITSSELFSDILIGELARVRGPNSLTTYQKIQLVADTHRDLSSSEKHVIADLAHKIYTGEEVDKETKYLSLSIEAADIMIQHPELFNNNIGKVNDLINHLHAQHFLTIDEAKHYLAEIIWKYIDPNVASQNMIQNNDLSQPQISVFDQVRKLRHLILSRFFKQSDLQADPMSVDKGELVNPSEITSEDEPNLNPENTVSVEVKNEESFPGSLDIFTEEERNSLKFESRFKIQQQFVEYYRSLILILEDVLTNFTMRYSLKYERLLNYYQKGDEEFENNQHDFVSSLLKMLKEVDMTQLESSELDNIMSLSQKLFYLFNLVHNGDAKIERL